MHLLLLTIIVVESFKLKNMYERNIMINIENEKWNQGEVPWFSILPESDTNTNINTNMNHININEFYNYKKILFDYEDPVWDSGEVSWDE